MKIDLIRKTDYYIGIPLCLIFSLWRKIFDQRQNPKSNSVKSIIFLKLLGMGSIILTRPLVQTIEKKYPKSNVFFITFSENKNIVKILGIPEKNILTINRSNLILFIKELFEVLYETRKIKPAITFDLEFFSRFSAVLSYLIGSPKRIGFIYPSNWELYRGNLHTNCVSYSPYQHTSEAFLNFASAAGLTSSSEIFSPKQDKVVNLQVKSNLLSNFPELRKRFIVLNINAGELALIRRWPIEKFISLTKKLLKKFPKYNLVLIGASSETSYINSFANKLNNNRRIVSLAGKTTLEDLLSIFSIAKVFITNDSGPMHLASLTNVPIVALFGPETPQLYHPLSSNCEAIYHPGPRSPCLTVFNSKQSACLKLDRRCSCMDNISVEDVYQKTLQLLTKNP